MAEDFTIYMTAQASSDLMEIERYIFPDSPQNAQSVYARVATAIFSLESLPRRGRVCITSKKPAKIVYALLEHPYIIYYRIRELDKMVEIVAIRRGTRRQPRRFR